MITENNTLTIIVAGSTNSGKSSVAELLRQTLYAAGMNVSLIDDGEKIDRPEIKKTVRELESKFGTIREKGTSIVIKTERTCHEKGNQMATKKTAKIDVNSMTMEQLKSLQSSISRKINEEEERGRLEEARKTELIVKQANERLAEIHVEINDLFAEAVTIVNSVPRSEYVSFEITVGDTYTSYNNVDAYWSTSS